MGGLLALITRAPLGLGPPQLWAGLRLGSPIALLAAGTVAATAQLPPVRRSMADREPPAAPPDWLLLRIPLGTVWSEESAFRGALTSAWLRCFR